MDRPWPEFLVTITDIVRCAAEASWCSDNKVRMLSNVAR